mgnify:CR=1 FL=1
MQSMKTWKFAAAAALFAAAFFFVLSRVDIRALNNGLALTPPMGWNSWNKFGCKIEEKVVRATG